MSSTVTLLKTSAITDIQDDLEAAVAADTAAAAASAIAAAASAATASATSGSGNGTFSNAALTGVSSVTAGSAVDLTLSGGSTGASLVLGHGATGVATFTMGTPSTGKLNIGAANVFVTGGDSGIWFNATDTFAIGIYESGDGMRFRTSGGDKMTLAASTGNLLIGTTTDMSGSGGLKVAGTTASIGVGSGALQVAGGIYAGALSNLKSFTLGYDTATYNSDATLSNYSAANGVYLNGNAAGWLRLSGSGGGVAQIQLNGGATGSITMNTATANALVLNGTTGAATFAGAVSASGTGAHTFGTTNTVSLNAGAITGTNSTAGGTTNFLIRNLDNTNAASAAVIQATVGGASAGDPRILLTVDAVVDWSLGVDNSDSDSFKIGPSGTVGTSTALTLTTAGAATFAGAVTIGGNVGFYNASPVAKPTGVAVTAAAIHAALVTLNLIT